MEDFILSALSKAKCDYADARICNSSGFSVRVKDSQVDAGESSSHALSVRVLHSGSWGMASSTEVSKESFLDALKKALALAKSTKGTEKLSGEICWSKKFEKKAKEAPDIGQKVKALLELESLLKQKRISNTSVYATSSLSRKVFLSSQGSHLEQSFPLTYVNMTSVAKDGSTTTQGFETKAAQSGFELISECFSLAPLVPKKAIRQLSALPSPKGAQAVVIDGKMAGVFAHEAIGHACEADSILQKESILWGKIGKQIGSPLISIVDDATHGSFGSFFFDDEGVPAKKKMLLEHGVLKSYLHSRATAASLGMQPTGNCRAQSCSDFPIVRMSNTFILSGKQKKEELFEQAKNAIYVKGMKGGSVEPLTGHFVFAAEEGFLVQGGEITKPLRDVSLSGEILRTLHSVSAVSDDFTVSQGFCGKSGQSVPVGDGGPHILIGEITVG
jgi:TldD protein